MEDPGSRSIKKKLRQTKVLSRRRTQTYTERNLNHPGEMVASGEFHRAGKNTKGRDREIEELIPLTEPAEVSEVSENKIGPDALHRDPSLCEGF